MNEVLQRVYETGIVPVVALDDPEKAVPLARALQRGGLNAVEVTFRTAAAEKVMRAIVENVPDMLVGAGTVITREQLDLALSIGAKFIVSPGFNPDMVKYGLSKGALMLPGTATGGEMEQAMALGLEVVKFFPAEQNGGIAKIKALAGPYRTLKWMPTGGVNTSNLNDYLGFNQVLACGGTWMVKKNLIDAERWDEVERISREAVKAMLNFSLMHIGINCADEAEAERTAKLFCTFFDMDYKPGNSSIFAGTAVECMKAPGRGTKGHIAIGTPNVDRAVYHLSQRGVEFDESSAKYNADGTRKMIYLKDEIGGFGVHLVKK